MSEPAAPAPVEQNAAGAPDAPRLPEIFASIMRPLLLFCLLLAGLAVFFSLSRSLQHGWHPVHLAHLLILAYLVFVYACRKRLSALWFSLALLAPIMIAALAGLVSFGLAGGGIELLTMFCLLVGVVFGRRFALAAVGAGLALIALAGVGYASGALAFTFGDVNEYLTSASAWVSVGLGFALCTVTLILCGAGIQERLQRDIAERRRAEKLLRLERDLGVSLGEAGDLRQLLERLLDALIGMEGIDSGGIHLRDETTGDLELIVHRGVSSGFLETVERVSGDSPTARLVARGEPIHTSYRAFPLPPGQEDLREGLRGVSVIPVRHEQRVIGVLNLASHVRDDFPAATRDALETIAGMVGGAIARAREQAARAESERRYRRAEAERENLWARLRQSEKMEAIGQLAGGVAHDFNNQLAGIVSYADLIRRRAASDERLARFADNILVAARRAADLTTQLLAFARKGKYLKVPVDLHRTIGEVVSLLEHSVDKRVAVRQRLAAPEALVLGDPSQLQNALLNLALNARDAMPGGGELVFATETAVLDEDACRRRRLEAGPGRYLEIAVSDTGTGIDERTRQHIFEPFFTTKEPGRGTGMGLAAVYGAVRGHQGAISVSSRPGAGSTFTILLPLASPAVKRAAGAEEAAAAPAAAGRVLLVEDEEIVREATAELLRELGYETVVCAGGAEAVERFRQSPKAFDLVILDMIMPGPGGRETYLALREINPRVAVLLSSGYSLEGEAQRILDLGVKAFIQKPFQREELAAKIAAVRDDAS